MQLKRKSSCIFGWNFLFSYIVLRIPACRGILLHCVLFLHKCIQKLVTAAVASTAAPTAAPATAPFRQMHKCSCRKILFARKIYICE